MTHVDQNPSPPLPKRFRRPGVYLDTYDRVRCGCGATREPAVIDTDKKGAHLYQCPECKRSRWMAAPTPSED